MAETLKVFGKSAVAKPLPPSRKILMVRDLPGKGVSYHINHLRRMWKSGQFPAPFYPSKRRCAWYEDTIDDWLAGKYAEQQAIDQQKEVENTT
jgi:hypothetical protein